jgi:hypothetical protein
VSPPRNDPNPTPDNLVRLGRKPSHNDLRTESDAIRAERIDNLVGLSREHAAMIPLIHENAKKALSEASRACAIATRVETIAEGTAEAVVGLGNEVRDLANGFADVSAAIIRGDAERHAREKREAATAGAAKGAGGIVGLGGIVLAVNEVLDHLPPAVAGFAALGLLLLVGLVLLLRRIRS